MPLSTYENRTLSQPEARLVADFLRVRYAVTVRNAFILWRKKPTEIIDWIKATNPDVKVPAEKIAQAAGRDVRDG